jgi:hypothetical protein
MDFVAEMRFGDVAARVRSPQRLELRIKIHGGTVPHGEESLCEAGGGNYQTLINDVLREHVEARAKPLEQTLRRVVREELARSRTRRG